MMKKGLSIGVGLMSVMGLLYFAIWQTRQIIVASESPSIRSLEFVNGFGEPISKSQPRKLRTLWAEKGRYYILVKLADNRQFKVHYFHSDSGKRRRVFIDINLVDDDSEAQVELRYGKVIIAQGRFPVDDFQYNIFDLMTLTQIPTSKSI